MFKKFSALIMVFIMAISCILPVLALGEEHRYYDEYVKALSDYLEGDTYAANLRSMKNSFDELRSYKMSAQFSTYIGVLLMIEDGDYKLISNSIRDLKADTRFIEYISENTAFALPDELQIYAQGRQAEDNNAFEMAKSCYSKVSGFFDSFFRIKEIEKAEAERENQFIAPPFVETAAVTFVNGSFTLGTFDQDGNPDNGAEPIAWRILAEQGDYLLAVSENVLFTSSYDAEGGSWEESDIRNYLNDEFYLTAFTANERKAIAKKMLKTPANPYYTHNNGCETNDYVFLLSMEEAQKYFTADTDRIAGNHSIYLLRDSGCIPSYCACVMTSGSINAYGVSQMAASGIRPTMYVHKENAEAAAGKTITLSSPSPFDVGDALMLGSTVQDNRLKAAPLPIEWRIIAVEDSRMLVISEYVLAKKSIGEATAWLNGEFLQTCFSEEEQKNILPVRRDSTEQMIFMLNDEEYHKYLASAEIRMPKIMPGSDMESVWPDESDYSWWLSSPSINMYSYYITDDGSISKYTMDKQLPFGIRPAMWISFS